MRILTIISIPLAIIFITLGAAKLLALAPMRARAEHAGFSVAAYRGIGALELAGAVGLLLGLAFPVLGALAGAGLLLLLTGAALTHVRNRDTVREITPALVCAMLVIGYLAAMGAST